MKLPGVRNRLYELAEEYKQDVKLSAELKKLADEIKRRPPIMRAKRSSRATTPAKIFILKNFHSLMRKLSPTWPMRKTGYLFNMDGGRVSEAVRGKRQ